MKTLKIKPRLVLKVVTDEYKSLYSIGKYCYSYDISSIIRSEYPMYCYDFNNYAKDCLTRKERFGEMLEPERKLLLCEASKFVFSWQYPLGLPYDLITEYSIKNFWLHFFIGSQQIKLCDSHNINVLGCLKLQVIAEIKL